LWTDDYLRKNMRETYSVEKSKDNHFMYFSGAVRAAALSRVALLHVCCVGEPNLAGRAQRATATQPKPTESVMMTYDKWWELAHDGDSGPTEPHYYLKMSVPTGAEPSGFIGRDLTHFANTEGFFVVNPAQQRVRWPPVRPHTTPYDSTVFAVTVACAGNPLPLRSAWHGCGGAL
jgi:hypothetical protein